MKTNRCVISERRRPAFELREVSLATHLEKELTNPSMIDVCYERLYGRLIGLMRMTRKSFVCACMCVRMCARVGTKPFCLVCPSIQWP